MAIKTEDVRYQDGSLSCLGYLAYNDAQTGRRPAVLVVHEAFGLGEHAMERARMLAELGYVAFAADLFGERRQVGMSEMRSAIGEFMTRPETLRQRAGGALSTLAALPQVDASRLFAIGFCFGGTAVLELARDGRDLLGVVAFHARLGSLAPALPGTMKSPVLALIGAEDPLITPDDRAAFEQEMHHAKADWQLIVYGNTQHSFTNPDAHDKDRPGFAYNAKADRLSWLAMKNFFEEQLNTRSRR